jgi:hypothetical protein
MKNAAKRGISVFSKMYQNLLFEQPLKMLQNGASACSAKCTKTYYLNNRSCTINGLYDRVIDSGNPSC